METQPNAEVYLSVVVVPVVGPAATAKCLDILTHQHTRPDEVIVPLKGADVDWELVQKQFPQVRFIKADGHQTFARLRAVGVRQARGAIIALTEDHCQPDPSWCAQIIAAHRQPHPAIGGVIEKHTPDRNLNWAVYFADYLRYMPPLEEGPTTALSDLNVSYKRRALDEIGPTWRDAFHENVVHAALLSRGHQLWLATDLVVRQQRDFTLGEALKDRFAFGRLLALTRTQNAPPTSRISYLAFSVAIPALLMLRLIRHIVRKRRWVGKFIQASPALILLSLVWGWGEMTGYLASLLPSRSISRGADAVQGR